MTPTEREYVESIERWHLSLDFWQCRIATPSWSAPEEHSALAHDDAHDYAWNPPSQVTAASICASVDHLHAARVLVLGSGQLFPFALQSLMRPALIGAAQAVWMLADDDSDTRKERAHIVRYENYRRHVQWLGNVESDEATQNHFIVRLSELAERPPPLNLTDVVNFAAAVTFDGHPQREELIRQTQATWQRTSGAAHALPWAIAHQPGMTIQPDRTGRSSLPVLSVGGSIEEAADTYNCAALILQRAWRLWERRTKSNPCGSVG